MTNYEYWRISVPLWRIMSSYDELLYLPMNYIFLWLTISSCDELYLHTNYIFIRTISSYDELYLPMTNYIFLWRTISSYDALYLPMTNSSFDELFYYYYDKTSKTMAIFQLSMLNFTFLWHMWHNVVVYCNVNLMIICLNGYKYAFIKTAILVLFKQLLWNVTILCVLLCVPLLWILVFDLFYGLWN